MKGHESSSAFSYTWLQMAKAFFVRYPNPYSTHVKTEDTLSRHVDAEGRLVTLKLLKKTNKAPQWTKKYIDFGESFVVERSVVDINRSNIETRTVNVDDSSRKFMIVKEVVTISPDDSKPGHSVMRRSAWIHSPMYYGLSYLISKMGCEKYAHNIKRTDDGFKHVLMQLFPRPGDAPPQTAPQKLLDKAQKATQKLKETSEQKLKETSEKKQEVGKVVLP